MAGGGTVATEETVIKVAVNEPIRLTALWETQYFVEVKGVYSDTNFTSGWVSRGVELNVKLMEEEIVMDNKTRLVFIGWNGSLRENPLKIQVNKPLLLVAEWMVQYWVEVTDPLGIIDLTSGWYNKSSEINVAPSRIKVDYGNGTRKVFEKWLVGNQTLESLRLGIKVDKPLTIAYSWYTEHLLEIHLHDTEGEPLEGEVHLSLSGLEYGFQAFFNGTRVWLREGVWNIGKTLYWVFDPETGERLRELEASSVNITLNALNPRTVNIVLRVYKVEFTIVDYLGVPVPWASVTIPLVNKSWVSTPTGYVVSLKLPEGRIEVKINFMGLEYTDYIDVKGEEKVFIRIPCSAYTLVAGLITGTVVAVLAKRKIKVKKEDESEDEFR